MNYCEERKIGKMPYFEILEDGHVIHRFKNTLDSEIEIPNELMAIPEVTITLPVEYLEYFYCQMEMKIHFRTCVFYGIVVSVETNKVDETLEVTVRHILEKWNYRQTPTNKAIKNKPMPEVLKDKDIIYEEDWNIEYDDVAKNHNVDYVYSRQSKFEALNRTVELTDNCWWRIDFQEEKNVEIGEFKDDSGYMLSTKPTGGRNIRILSEPIINEDYSNVINIATVYSEKNDNGASSVSLREVYNNKELQDEKFPVVIIRNYINNERDYDWGKESPVMAPNNDLEYAIIDTEGLALSCGVFKEGTFAFNDLSPFQEEELTEQGKEDTSVKWVVPTEQRYLTEVESKNNAHAFYNYFKGKWSDLAIASILGAIYYESTLNPNIWQGLDPNYMPAQYEGFGLVQWTPYTRITNWLNERGYQVADYGIGECKKLEEEWASGTTNAEWIPTASYPETFQQWAQTTNKSVEYMVMAYMVDYGRGDTRLDLRYADRIAMATKILNEWIPEFKKGSTEDNQTTQSSQTQSTIQIENRPSGTGNWDPQKFMNTWTNKSSDIDGVAGMQCVDTYKEILKVVGYPNPTRPIGGDGYAHQIWYLRNSSGIMEYFNQVDGNPQLGDVAVWSMGGQTPYSHVAMFVKDNGDGTGLFFGQNQPHAYHNLSSINIGNILGFLRVKDRYWTPSASGNTTNEQPNDTTENEITDLDRILTASTVYRSAIKKLVNSRPVYEFTLDTEELPCDIKPGQYIKLLYDNQILKFDKCSNYMKKVLTLNNDFYITSLSRILHKDGSITGQLTLNKYLRVERETQES